MVGRWLLVSKADGEFGVVNVRSVKSDKIKEMNISDFVQIAKRGGGTEKVQIIAFSDDRQEMEQQAAVMRQDNEIDLGMKRIVYDDFADDFSASCSSWGPSSRNSTDTEEETMQIKGEDFTSKNVRTPTLKAKAVIPKRENKTKLINSTFRDQVNYISPETLEPKRGVHISEEEILKVKRDIGHFKGMLGNLRTTIAGMRLSLSADHLYETVYATHNTEQVSVVFEKEQVDPYNMEEDHDLTPFTKDKSALIDKRPVQAIKPIRYGVIKSNSVKGSKSDSKDVVSRPVHNIKPNVRAYNRNSTPVHQMPSTNNDDQVEANANNQNEMMFPIGSGHTLVPQTLYESINWQSYTMATRKLLMAVFPRRTLATHSLTGKSSPAFTNKPAKLCLDQMKVQDIIKTVSENCKVKENLVRNAITIKCADENKMLRIQADKENKKKTKNEKSTSPKSNLANDQTKRREKRRLTENIRQYESKRPHIANNTQ